MIRLAFTIFTTFVAGLLLAPIGILAWPFRRDGEIGFRITQVWASVILKAARVRTVTQLQGTLPDVPVVFVSNHVSALDIPILFAALPRSFRIVYKSSLLYVPLLGLFVAAARNIPIDRSRAFSARRSLSAAARRIRAGVSVALFPEGTRGGGERMGPFKRGSFKLAVEAGAPVVPVSLIGLRDVVQNGRIIPGVVTVKVHAALPLAEGQGAVDELATRAESVIRNEVETK